MARNFLTSINLNKNELQNAVVQNLANAPGSPSPGQIYYNTGDQKFYYRTSSAWVDLSAVTTYTNGTGLTLTTGTFAIDPAYSGFTNYYTKTQIDAGYQPLDADLTAIAGLTANGLLRKTAGTWGMDTATYLTAEADTLATVTGRGATTSTAVSLTNATASTSTGTGALIVTGGVGIGGNANVGGNMVIAGDLTVNGTTTTVNSTVTTIDDTVITLGGDTVVAEVTKDRGIEAKWNGIALTMTNFIGNGSTTVTGTVASTAGYAAGDIITISGATGTEQTKLNGTWKIVSVPNATTFTFVVASSVAAGTLTTTIGTTIKSKNAFFGLDQSSGKLIFIPQADNNSEVFSGTKGVIDATILGADVSGAVASASALANARSIAITGDLTYSVSFDGSTNVTAVGTLAASGATATTYGGSATQITTFSVDAKGRITSAPTNVTITPAFSSITSKPTTLAGYGITDAIKKYAAAFGDGTTLAYAIAHNLNTRDCTVQVVRATTPWDQVECDVEMTDVNTVTLSFVTAPTTNQYRVIVVG